MIKIVSLADFPYDVQNSRFMYKNLFSEGKLVAYLPCNLTKGYEISVSYCNQNRSLILRGIFMKKTTFIAILLSFFAILMTVQISVTTQADNSSVAIESVTQMCQDKIQFDLGFTAASAQDPDPNPSDCHDNGDCESICGSGFTACTYMDCGSGTQLCHKS